MKEVFRIPFSKPDFNHQETQAIIDVLKSGWPSQGKITEKFEKLISKYLKSSVSVVNNGSSALASALIANEIKPGDNVIVPAFTYVASGSIPKLFGANVIAVDVDPETFNMSPESVEKVLKKQKVKAIILVDVGGLPADIDTFVDITKRYKIKLIEDAAQAFGSEYKNKKVGAFEHTIIFSFQITKQITTIEGGCVASLNEKIIKKINKLKDYGRSAHGRYIHDVIGTNFRTTDIQSAMGIVQLQKIEKHITQREKIVKKYREELTNFKFQKTPDYVSRHSNLLFFLLTKNKIQKLKIIKQLTKQKIDAREAWVPINLQPCNITSLKTNCKNAEDIFNRAVTLPIFNSMTIEEAEKVSNTIKELEE